LKHGISGSGNSNLPNIPWCHDWTVDCKLKDVMDVGDQKNAISTIAECEWKASHEEKNRTY
jgi:hypothetical protein